MILTYDTADDVVAEASKPKRQVYWDGWTICIFRPNDRAWNKLTGRFRDGKWGFESRIPVSGDGTWGVPSDFVK